MFFKIYIGISIVTFVVFLLATHDFILRIKRDISFEYNDENIAIIPLVKMLLISFVPVLNIGLLYVLIFNSELVYDATLSKVLKD